MTQQESATEQPMAEMPNELPRKVFKEEKKKRNKHPEKDSERPLLGEREIQASSPQVMSVNSVCVIALSARRQYTACLISPPPTHT